MIPYQGPFITTPFSTNVVIDRFGSDTDPLSHILLAAYGVHETLFVDQWISHKKQYIV